MLTAVGARGQAAGRKTAFEISRWARLRKAGNGISDFLSPQLGTRTGGIASTAHPSTAGRTSRNAHPYANDPSSGAPPRSRCPTSHKPSHHNEPKKLASSFNHSVLSVLRSPSIL